MTNYMGEMLIKAAQYYNKSYLFILIVSNLQSQKYG